MYGYNVEGFGKASDLLLDTARERRIGALFDVWDADSSGFLETTELNKVMKLYQETIAEKDRVLESDADADAGVLFWYDGDSDGKISREEFKGWFKDLVSSFQGEKFIDALNGITAAVKAAGGGTKTEG